MECFQKPIFYRDDFVPAKLTGLPSWKEKGGIPINQEVREEINKKKRLHKKWIRSKHQPDNQLIHDSYKRVRNRVKKVDVAKEKGLRKENWFKRKTKPEKILGTHKQQVEIKNRSCSIMPQCYR